jgi:hypothetical protein
MSPGRCIFIILHFAACFPINSAIAAPGRQELHYEGVYVGTPAEDEKKYCLFLRFFPNGLVFTVTTVCDTNVMPMRNWLGTQAPKYQSHGKVRIDADRVSFDSADQYGTVSYAGTIAGEHLELDVHSRINGFKHHERYAFTSWVRAKENTAAKRSADMKRNPIFEVKESDDTTFSPPAGTEFDSDILTSKGELSAFLKSPRLTSKLSATLSKHKCKASVFTAYTNTLSKKFLLVSDCNAESENDGTSEFPIMFVVSGGELVELENLSEFGFMYGNGKLKYVTDLDKNGRLELWLEGDISECDGDDECNPSGTTVVEELSGKLYKVDFAKKRLDLRKSER